MLNVIGVTILFLLVAAIVSPIERMDEKGVINTLLSVAFGTLFFSSYLIIIFNLKEVLKSVLGRNPFIHESVTRFRRIGYCIFSIGMIDAIIRYPDVDRTGLTLIGTDKGSK